MFTDVSVTPRVQNSQYTTKELDTSTQLSENGKSNSSPKIIVKQKSSTNESDSLPALIQTHEACKSNFLPINIAQVYLTWRSNG